MRFLRPWRVDKWLPVAMAFQRMAREIDAHPEIGCLGHHEWVGRTTVSVQYWRDFESLRAFARGDALPHLTAWRRFNRTVGDSGDVGVWHETYLVPADRYEAVYTNMPVFGLAAAGAHVPVARRGESAAARLGLPD
jgi:hypothetical protein